MAIIPEAQYFVVWGILIPFNTIQWIKPWKRCYFFFFNCLKMIYNKTVYISKSFQSSRSQIQGAVNRGSVSSHCPWSCRSLGGGGSYLPTKFSSTELLPALWPPTTAICGRWRLQLRPTLLRASCSRLTSGISSSIPRLPIATEPPDHPSGSFKSCPTQLLGSASR